MKDFHKKNSERREASNKQKSVVDELEELRQEIRARKSKAKNFNPKNRKEDPDKETFKDKRKFKNSYNKEGGKFNSSNSRPYKEHKKFNAPSEKPGGFHKGSGRYNKPDREEFSSKRAEHQNKRKEYNKSFEKDDLKGKKTNKENYKGGNRAENGKAHKYSLRRKSKGFENDEKKDKRSNSASFSGKKPVAKNSDGLIRLNKYISNAGVCSRRDADELIASGQISVNNKVVTELGYKVKREDVVKYNNKILQPEKMVYVLLNKPKDYITTTEDPENRKTIMELVQDVGDERIYPVGRLDRNTTGLIMLTNDGELADKLAHPSNNVKKIYQVDLDKPLTQNHFEEIKKGLVLDDGVAYVDDIEVLSADKTILGIELHIGRNRIVRRIFEHLGYEVVRLDRVMYAGLTKKDLPRGRYRFLSEKEVINLKHLQK